MSNLELPGTLNLSPAADFTQVSLPSSLYSHEPATHSMISGAPVLKVSVAGSDTWVKSSAGEQFNVPGNSKFDIRVTEAYHYICHFG